MAAAVKLEFSSLDAMKTLVPVCHHLFTKHLHLCILQMSKGFAMQNDAKFLFFEHCSPIKFLSQLALVLSIILVIFLFCFSSKTLIITFSFFVFNGSSLLFYSLFLDSCLLLLVPTFSSVSCLLPLVSTSFSLLLSLSSVGPHFFLPSLILSSVGPHFFFL